MVSRLAGWPAAAVRPELDDIRDILLYQWERGPVTNGEGADFDLRDSCSGGSVVAVTVNGPGPHPAQMRVPCQWLESLSAGPMAACFRLFTPFRAVGSPYLADVRVTTQLAWRIDVREP